MVNQSTSQRKLLSSLPPFSVGVYVIKERFALQELVDPILTASLSKEAII